MREEFLWVEKYRPRTIADCILPEDMKNTFRSLKDKGEIINMLFSGTAGTGKTTIARALCEELGCDYIVINCSDNRGIDLVRSEVPSFATTVSMSGKPKVIILDEADYLTPVAQAALRNLIETLSKNCRFIFTCNYKHRIIPALQSRCSSFDFVFPKDELPALMSQMTKRIMTILKEEKVEFTLPAVVELVKQFSPDNRKILNELQRYSNINGSIDTGLFASINASSIKNYVNLMKSGDFKGCRQFIKDNPDPDTIFKELYENIVDYVSPESVPNMILIIGEYQNRAAFVANQEINLAAFTVELLKSMKWK